MHYTKFGVIPFGENMLPSSNLFFVPSTTEYHPTNYSNFYIQLAFINVIASFVMHILANGVPEGHFASLP